jgi:hypothetical protein
MAHWRALVYSLTGSKIISSDAFQNGLVIVEAVSLLEKRGKL